MILIDCRVHMVSRLSVIISGRRTTRPFCGSSSSVCVAMDYRMVFVFRFVSHVRSRLHDFVCFLILGHDNNRRQDVFGAVPCCAVPRHAVSCCYAVPCCAVPYSAVRCCSIQCRAVLYTGAVPCGAIPCRAMLYYVVLCRASVFQGFLWRSSLSF